MCREPGECASPLGDCEMDVPPASRHDHECDTDRARDTIVYVSSPSLLAKGVNELQLGHTMVIKLF